jgi:hypothetical protein
MEKLVLKGKKEIRMMLTDSFHETIKTVGLSKAAKKVEKVLERTSRKLAAQVARQMKKELKKMRKANNKGKREKRSNHHQPVAA